MNSVGATDLEATRKDTKYDKCLNGPNMETAKANTQDFSCTSAIQSETTKEDTESVISSNVSKTETTKVNTKDGDCLNTIQLESPKKDTKKVDSYKGTGTETTIPEDVDCSSDGESENTSEASKTDAETDASLSAASSKSGSQDGTVISAAISSISKVFHELGWKIMDGTKNFLEEELSMISTIYSLYERMMILRNFNKSVDMAITYLEVDGYALNNGPEKLENGGDSSATSLENGSQDGPGVSTAISSFTKVFDDLGLKIVDGAENFLEEEHSLISTIYSLYQRLMSLRKFNETVDSVIADLQLAYADYDVPEMPKSGDSSAESDSTEADGKCRLWDDSESEEAADGAETDDSSSESDDDSTVDWSKEITCICTLCDKPINIPPDRDINFMMEAHLCRQHPSRRLPADSASSDDDSESEAESEPPDDPTILLDGTKVEDFEVRFDEENALKHIVHSDGIFAKDREMGQYACSICSCCLPRKKFLIHHLKSRGHRAKVREYAEYSQRVKKNHVVRVDPDLLVICRGQLYCLECHLYLFNPHMVLSHVSEQHEQGLKLDFPVVRVGDSEFCLLCDLRVKAGGGCAQHVAQKEHYIEYLKVTTVVQLKSIKFCSLCNVKLFTETQFNAHVIDDSHVSNLQLIESNVRNM